MVEDRPLDERLRIKRAESEGIEAFDEEQKLFDYRISEHELYTPSHLMPRPKKAEETREKLTKRDYFQMTTKNFEILHGYKGVVEYRDGIMTIRLDVGRGTGEDAYNRLKKLTEDEAFSREKQLTPQEEFNIVKEKVK